MGHRADDIRPRGAKVSVLHDRVAQWYYSHGLFCSTYPISVIFCAISATLLCCYPLLNLPLSSNPLAMRSSTLTSQPPGLNWTFTLSGAGAGDGGPLGADAAAQQSPPWCYVQQVVLRTAVVPWTDALSLGDAFRSPLYEAFNLLDAVRNYEDVNSTKTLGHVCLHVENIKNKNLRNDILPEYSCLVLSPANFWRQDVQQFSQDNSILNTVFNYQSLQKGKTSLSEILFGMHLAETGIKRYPLRNRQRVIQYAITLFLKDYDQAFISGLQHKLQTIYPLHQDPNNTQHNINETVLIYYPGEVNYYEFIPLIISFVLLFLYYYFSVRKIEMIKSKIGMAFTVFMTVLCSLFMTLGVCFFFGLTLCLQGKEIFPYLVILVGLENVLVLTKSVVTTPAHLDIKIRVAQGLSKEGWSITKNLLIEITILTMGMFTFVPVIQEFCIFAVVGLINDFFLQMSFFSTILGIDTRRMENLADKTNPSFRSNLYQTHNYEKYNVTGMSRSKSQPRLNNMHTNIVAGQTQSMAEKKIPKRLRLVNIWARTRFFQRAFMILMVTWIAIILYNSGVLEQFLINEHSNENGINASRNNKTSSQVLPILNSDQNYLVNYVTQKTSDFDYQRHNSDVLNKLKHPDFSAPWMKLSTQHWPTILRKYNVSLSGQSIAVLPSIMLSHAIAPEQAILLRNPDEKYGQKFQWQALAAALDPIDFADVDTGSGQQSTSPLHHPPDQPFYPTSPVAIALVACLALISCLVLCYAVVVLYKCVCSRHYAEWRAGWFAKRAAGGAASSGDEAAEVPLLLEAVPVVVKGHREEVECLATDGFSVVSSGLGSGMVKVWDSATGEVLSHIDRNTFFSDMNQERSPDPTTTTNDYYDYDTTCSDYGSGSPPSRDEHLHHMTFPSLKHRINTNFVNLHLDAASPPNDRYDFDRPYKQLYCEGGGDDDERAHLRHRATNHDTTVRWLRSTMATSPISVGACAVNGVRRRSAGAGHTHQQQQHKGHAPPIWCLDCVDNLVVIGCADGRLEFWEGTTAKFKCLVEDDSGANPSGAGVTSVKIVGARVIAARLSGSLDFLHLQTYNQGRPIDWNFTSAYRRTHIRTGSAGSIADMRLLQPDKEDLRCVRVLSTRAHQQPITCLDCEGGNVVTGSADHTLKVFRLDDGSPKYTLHGHCGPITCLFIDRICPATSGSGSQDGMLCVWDLLTGACMYSVQAHDGPLTALTYSASYVISLGADERACVWERFQGHLLNAIALPPHCSGAAHLLMLTPHLLVTARAGGLALWDVRTGDSVRTIVLGHTPYVFVRQMVLVREAVLCDFGRELRIVRFPLIAHKFE